MESYELTLPSRPDQKTSDLTKFFFGVMLGVSVTSLIFVSMLEVSNRKAHEALEAEKHSHLETCKELQMLRASYAAGLKIDL